jgi:soluble lytic murein transglycosylase
MDYGQHETMILDYSSKYDSLIRFYANLYSRDPQQVKRQIRCESDFNPRAQSPQGATGLMQFLPNTWYELAGKLVAYDIYNPELSIKYGCKYMANLEKEFKSLEMALAAYNWGSGNLTKHLRSLDLVRTWKDGLPLETQNYITKCMDYKNEVLSA